MFISDIEIFLFIDAAKHTIYVLV